MITVERLNYLRQAVRVQRCHTEPVLYRQTVGEHCCSVAILCYYLTKGKPSANLLMAALTHDLAERRWGDIPGDVKSALGLDKLLVNYECHTLEEMGLPTERGLMLTKDEVRTLHFADKLDLLLYCTVEHAQGNKMISSMYTKLMDIIYTKFNPLLEIERQALFYTNLLHKEF